PLARSHTCAPQLVSSVQREGTDRHCPDPGSQTPGSHSLSSLQPRLASTQLPATQISGAVQSSSWEHSATGASTHKPSGPHARSPQSASELHCGRQKPSVGSPLLKLSQTTLARPPQSPPSSALGSQARRQMPLPPPIPTHTAPASGQGI